MCSSEGQFHLVVCECFSVFPCVVSCSIVWIFLSLDSSLHLWIIPSYSFEFGFMFFFLIYLLPDFSPATAHVSLYFSQVVSCVWVLTSVISLSIQAIMACCMTRHISILVYIPKFEEWIWNQQKPNDTQWTWWQSPGWLGPWLLGHLKYGDNHLILY